MRNLKKVAAITGAVLVVLFAVVTYVALWTGSTEDIEAVADKFQPGDDWTLVSERIEPPRMMCLGGDPCPYLVYAWKREEALTRDEFETMIREAGWDFPVEDDCEVSETMSGSVGLCSSDGADNGYEITVRYSSPNIDNTEPKLSILIRNTIEE